MQAWQIPFWGSPPTPNRTAADATGANGCPQHPTLPRPAKAKPHGPNIGSGTEPVSGNATRRRKISPPFSSLKKTSQSFSNKQSNAPISKGDRGIFVRHRNLGQYRTTATIRITGRPFCKNQLGRPCFCSQERTDSSCQAGSVSQNQIR